MSEGNIEAEKKSSARQKPDHKSRLDLRSKLDLDDVDLGVTLPSQT